MLNDRCPRGGSLDRHTGEEIALKHPALQVFEKTAKPAAAPDAKAPEPKAAEVQAAEVQASDPKAPAAKAPAAQTLASTFPKLSLKPRAASEAG